MFDAFLQGTVGVLPIITIPLFLWAVLVTCFLAALQQATSTFNGRDGVFYALLLTAITVFFGSLWLLGISLGEATG